MPKRSRTPPEEDINELAHRIGDQTTASPRKEKNPAAVALGTLGGKRGGKARARKLTPKRRSEIARIAAKSRWSSKS